MILYPKEYLENVCKIDVDLIEKYNIKALILDVDNTLIDINKNISDDILNWATNMKNYIKLCILSNSNHKDKVETVAKKLDIPYIFFAKKPLKSGFKRAAEVLNESNEYIGVVGDQIFTDVLGANRCNMVSILVQPISKKDLLFTKLKRPIENFIIKKYTKEKEVWKVCAILFQTKLCL